MRASTPLFIISVIIATSLMIPGIKLVKSATLAITIEDNKVFLSDGDLTSLSDLNNDYVVTVHITSGPITNPLAINRGKIFGKGDRIMFRINKLQFISIWKPAIKTTSSNITVVKNSGYTLPSITVFIMAFANNKTYAGSVVIDPYYILAVCGGTVEDLFDVRNDPIRPFLENSEVSIAVTLYPINTSGLIDDALNNVSHIMNSTRVNTGGIHSRENTLLLLDPPPSPNALMEVYNEDLFDLRYSPPQKFLNKIVLNGSPYSKGDKVWRFLMERFSVKFYLPKSEFSMEDALEWFLLGYGDGDSIYTMDGFVNKVVHYVLHDSVDAVDWVDASFPTVSLDIPLLCIKASYYGDDDAVDKDVFEGIIHTSEYSSHERGMSFWGFLLWSESREVSAEYTRTIHVTRDAPCKCITAPASIFTVGWDVLVVIPVVKSFAFNGDGYWLIYGSFALLPVTTIDIEYSAMHAVASEDGQIPLDPDELDKLTWSLSTAELFYSTVTKSSPPPPRNMEQEVFYYNSSTTRYNSLYGYAGAAISYYFGLLGQFLYHLGIIGTVVQTLAELIGMSTGSYYALALFLVFIASSFNIVIHNAYTISTSIKFYALRLQYDNGDSSEVRICKDTIKYGVAGFSPTSIIYNVEVMPYFPEPPPGADAR